MSSRSPADAGHLAVPLSRFGGVDLVSGSGLGQALGQADVVIDVSNVETLKTDVSVSFFAGATRNLLAAERKLGIPHHIALSIVGVDAAPEGYYAGKLSPGTTDRSRRRRLDHPSRNAVP